MSPFLTDYDLYLLGEGKHNRLYEKLGAHLIEQDGIAGTHFAVWAPNARGLRHRRFQRLDPRHLHLNSRGDLRRLGRFHSRHRRRRRFTNSPSPRSTTITAVEKADPCGFAAEIRPHTASKVWDLSGYKWNDADWMTVAAGKTTPSMRRSRSMRFILAPGGASPRKAIAG